MDIYPQDLGKTLCSRILRDRLSAYWLEANIKPMPVGIACLASVAATLTFGLFLYPEVTATLIKCDFALAGMYAFAVGRGSLRRILSRKPLSKGEITKIHVNAQDTLGQQYLSLLQVIIDTRTEADPMAQDDVRGAVRFLLTAIEKLPAQDAEAVTDDQITLEQQAQLILVEADAEPDVVIRASLQRRAASLFHRAGTVTRTKLLLRRNVALRAEVAEQIEALQTSLTALKFGASQGAGELAGLAASIQSVAIAANAITEARAEVDSYLHLESNETDGSLAINRGQA